MAKIITVNGNAQIDTAEKKFGTGSGLFDGAGDYLGFNPEAQADFNFGSGDWTVDFWLRPNASVNAFTALLVGGLSWAAGSTSIQFLSSQEVLMTSWDWWNSHGNTHLLISSALTLSTWYHIAIVRNGTDIAIYIDGVSNVSETIPSGEVFNFNYSNQTRIGGGTWDGAEGYYDGWIDEYRISKGIARWTTGFTKPASAYPCANSNTKLLVHFDGADTSTNITDDDTACGLATVKSINGLAIASIKSINGLEKDYAKSINGLE